MSANIKGKSKEVTHKAAEVANKVSSEGVKTYDGDIVKPMGMVASKAAAGVSKAAEESKEVQAVREEAKNVDPQKYINMNTQALQQSFPTSPLAQQIEALDDDEELEPEEVMEVLKALVETTLSGDATVLGTAQASSEALAKRIDAVANQLTHTSGKLAKNLARVATELERKRIFSTGSMLDDAKGGKLHIKNHVIDLGAIFVALILQKSMRYVVSTSKDKAEGDSFSLNNVTDMFYETGDTSFIANPKLAVNHMYATVTQPGGAGTAIIVAKKTPTELATVNVALADLEPTKAYVCTVVYLNDTGAGTLVGNTTQLILTGKELADVAEFKLIPTTAFTLSGTTNTSIPAASLDQTGIGNVVLCQDISPSGESLRVSGAVDLRGAAQVAAWSVGTHWSDWWSVISPFFMNTLGNVFSKDQLVDFLGKNK
jgi:hypothetical protein